MNVNLFTTFRMNPTVKVMFNPMEPYLMARFPSRSIAELFVESHAAYINVGIITDSQQLHPDVKDTLPVQVNYQLKKPDMTKLVTDAYGNTIPSTLNE